jgi:peptidylprolyl isomerase
MKLASTFLIFAAAAVTACAPLQAQTTTHSAVHHTAVRKHPAATGCSTEAAQPVLPAAVPRIAGCTDVLYALRYIDTVAGTGAPVVPRRWLTVAYTGYLMDGTKFDSSIGKDPITFPYGAHQVITGWDTGFEGMKVGGKRRLYIPYQLAYGETGRAPVIPAKAELVFDVELVAVSENPPTPKTPPTPPAGSRRDRRGAFEHPADRRQAHCDACTDQHGSSDRPHQTHSGATPAPCNNAEALGATSSSNRYARTAKASRTLPPALLETARLGRGRDHYL